MNGALKLKWNSIVKEERYELLKDAPAGCDRKLIYSFAQLATIVQILKN